MSLSSSKFKIQTTDLKSRIFITAGSDLRKNDADINYLQGRTFDCTLRPALQVATCSYENKALRAASTSNPVNPEILGTLIQTISYSRPKTSFLPNFNNKTSSVAPFSLYRLGFPLAFSLHYLTKSRTGDNGATDAKRPDSQKEFRNMLKLNKIYNMLNMCNPLTVTSKVKYFCAGVLTLLYYTGVLIK
jgi:hypothetical protein